MPKNAHVVTPLEVQLERVLPGPIEKVWNYLTTSELLATWLAGALIDGRAGGAVTFRKLDTVYGQITRCEPPSVLEYTLFPYRGKQVGERGQPVSETVTFELEPRGEQVVLRLTVRRPVAESRPVIVAHQQAYANCLTTSLEVTVAFYLDVIIDTLENETFYLRAA